MRRRGIVAAALLALVAGTGCTAKNVDEAHVGVRYTAGSFDGEHFEKVVEPGGTEWVGNDKVHLLPTRQITWIMSNNGGDAPALTITAEGGEKLLMGLTVRGFLNTRESTIEQFFPEICQKDRTTADGNTVDGCWENASEMGVTGWILMLQDAFGDPAIAVANDVASTFDAEKLRYDSETKRRFEREFATAFRTQQKRMIGNSGYFCGPGYERDETDRDADGWCPDLAVQVTGIVFENPDLENVKSEQALSEEREDLAVQEAATARAQQAAQNARATPQNLELMEKEAMLACAQKESGCNLTIISGGEDVSLAVPAG